ncbi:MAG: hypothetical protein NZM27_08320 [Acetobacteraceae bacterium]|nr:hypothetical protein [Acetobacteraceae bacterium]MCX7685813.1 hypothetical protein [Acetobacteraceae bacterium]
MIHRVAASSHSRASTRTTLDALQEIASGGLAERARIESVARILVLARRAAALAGRGPLARGESLVERTAARWEPSEMTATEFAELLTPAERDRLIAAAPAWAAAQLPDETRRAA